MEAATATRAPKAVWARARVIGPDMIPPFLGASLIPLRINPLFVGWRVMKVVTMPIGIIPDGPVRPSPHPAYRVTFKSNARVNGFWLGGATCTVTRHAPFMLNSASVV
jgi:hypothetical protein